MKILIVEDNQKLAGYIKKALEQKSYTVDCVYDGETGESRVEFGEYDLVVLDWMLPKKDGITVCSNLRNKNINVPIIILTAKDELDDKITGLDSGADDYLVKPFELEELLARIRALLRRPKEKIGEVLIAQDVLVDNAKHIITKNKIELSLTLKEYAILEYLIQNKGQVITRDQILEHCWDFSFDSFSNIVDGFIKQLRKKLNDKDEKYIKTIRGIGYKFQE
ncbi:MAG: response regulator transcription factor [Patescibacteria group bacterium]